MAGEPLTHDLVQQIYARSKVQKVFNLYGPSEDTTYSTYALIEEGAQSEPTIGRPIANTQAYILDQALQPVPIGVAGELHLGGAGLARGYLNRAELTAEKFITNPFGQGRLYKTGDLCRYLPDGNIEFLGRMDHQVKIRGFRIELGEIAAGLRQHLNVREVAVLAQEDTAGDKRLVAYMVPAQEAVPTVGELRRFLQEKLPNYMVPSAFVFLEKLPLTPNGKVDRRALPTPDLSHIELESEYAAPRSPIEEVLAGMWRDLLKVPQVGIHDNLFDLGGHSLLATQVISRIRDTFHIELPLRTLFETPTVATLAERLESARRTEPEMARLTRQSAPRNGALSLSFAQQRLWFLDQLEPESTVYNIPSAFHLNGALNVRALEQSLQEIVRRHEVLRTTFSMKAGRPIQLIVPNITLVLPVVDLFQLPEKEREAEARRLAAEEAQRSFDLSKGPLLRASLLKLGEAEHILLLTVHHIASDGWSMAVLFQELSALYKAFSAGQPSPLPELPIQYADYAIWQREWLQGEVLERQLGYWKTQLEGAPPVSELPLDRPRPVAQTYCGARLAVAFSQSLSDKLRALSRQESVTLFMTLLAAFKMLLYRQSGQDDIIVGSPIAGRQPYRDGGTHRLLSQQFGLTHRFVGQPYFWSASLARTPGSFGCLCKSRSSLRKVVRRAPTGARPQSATSLPTLFQHAYR